MDKIRIGVIGIGNMGSSHAKNFASGRFDDFVLTAVADVKPARLEWAAKELPETVARFDTAEALMESGLADAVLIATPHYFHPPLSIAAMRHGLHVLSEKPAGVYTKQVRELNAEADKHDTVFAVMFNQRTNHVYRKMRELVQSGQYGQIRRTNWLITNWYRPQAYYDSGDWRATWSGEGGGVLMNQCPHQLDLFQWICGMPKTVSAKLQFGLWHNIEVEDDVTAFFQYENGATGCFITTTGDPCGTNRFEVQMDRAKLVVEDGVLKVWELEQAEPEFTRTCTEAFGSIKATEITPETDGLDEEHDGVIRAFGGAILRGTPLVADGREGIRGLTLSNAMHLSAWLGRPIELPLDEELYYNELMKRVATSQRKTEVHEQIGDAMKMYRKS